MKQLVIVVAVLVFGGVAYFAITKTNTQTYVQNEPTVVEKEVEVESVDKRIEQALKDAEQDIENKSKASYDQTRANEESKIRTQVRDAYIAELELINESEKKEQTEYWSVQGNVVRLIRETFPEEPQKAVAIAMAESRLNPRALNSGDSHKGCKGSYGIFQIGCLHESDPRILYNVEYNIKRARELYDQSGWAPWGAYTDGSYKNYLAYR